MGIGPVGAGMLLGGGVHELCAPVRQPPSDLPQCYQRQLAMSPAGLAPPCRMWLLCLDSWDCAQTCQLGLCPDACAVRFPQEEADILCDRIAIMVDGRLAADGTPLDLKATFGVGYTLTIVTDQPVAAE